jgi:hypothetical protein
MRWILESGEYSRQRETLRRRTNCEQADWLPNLTWEPADDADPDRDWEPEPLPRPRDLRPRAARRSRPS